MVFTVAPTLYTDVIRDVGEFRRKDLFDSRSFTATHVEFKRGAETIRWTRRRTRTAPRWKTANNAAGKQIDAMKVEDLLAKVSSLRAESFDAAIERSTQESRAGRDGPLRRQQDGAGHLRRGRQTSRQPRRTNPGLRS